MLTRTCLGSRQTTTSAGADKSLPLPMACGRSGSRSLRHIRQQRPRLPVREAAAQRTDAAETDYSGSCPSLDRHQPQD